MGRRETAGPFFQGPAIDGWGKVIDAVHTAGGVMGPQIWHCCSIASMSSDYGRALITDAQWANKFRDGRMAELQGFTPNALGTFIQYRLGWTFPIIPAIGRVP